MWVVGVLRNLHLLPFVVPSEAWQDARSSRDSLAEAFILGKTPA